MPISRIILSILLLVVTEGIVVLSPKIRHFITKRILEYAHSARKDMNDFRVYIMTPQSEIVPKESCMFTFGEIESTYTFKLF